MGIRRTAEVGFLVRVRHCSGTLVKAQDQGTNGEGLLRFEVQHRDGEVPPPGPRGVDAEGLAQKQ